MHTLSWCLFYLLLFIKVRKSTVKSSSDGNKPGQEEILMPEIERIIQVQTSALRLIQEQL